jgi:RNA polymerase sigma factor (sigma-70 family)
MGALATTYQPWLDDKGRILNDKELKEISMDWTHETWESYLSYIEIPRSESLIEEFHFDSIAETNHIFDDLPDTNRNKKLHSAIKKLTKKQQKIIFLIFFEGLSVREIALRMNISHGSVHDLKIRALNSLKSQIEGADTLRIMRGKNSKPFMKQGESYERQHHQDHTSWAS